MINKIENEIASILADAPQSFWDLIIQNEPEWTHMIGLLDKFAFGPFATFMMAAALNDYQLSEPAEKGYWPVLGKILDNNEPPKNKSELYTVLEDFYRNEKLGEQKLFRMKRFLDSRLAELIWIRPISAVANGYKKIWFELARVMNQAPEAKTISFAMKCLGLSLIMAGIYEFDFSGIPIPVDYRIIEFSKKSNLYIGDSHDEIRKIWNNILFQISQRNPKVTMIHLDSLIWQIGKLSKKGVVNYFQTFNCESIGYRLSKLMTDGSLTLADSITDANYKNEFENSCTSRVKRKIICFVPCCKTKRPTGIITDPVYHFSESKLPDSYPYLLEGRKCMQSVIKHSSNLTSALNLYTGSFYKPIDDMKSQIVNMIRSDEFQLYIVSAGYGVVHALEPINDYDAVMKGDTAHLWKNNQLSYVLKELLLMERPTHVFGCFAGDQGWSDSSSVYRYFFTEAVQSALKNGLNCSAGCIYRVAGLGSVEILEALGRSFRQLINTINQQPDELENEKLYSQTGQISIGFQRIS